MTPLLFWKIIGYGILIFFGLGIALSILSAVATILMPIIVPLFFLAVFALCIVTYPITLILRVLGYRSKSLFTFVLEKYETQKETSKGQSYKERRCEEYTESKTPPKTEPKKLSPWEILGIEKGASKDKIGAAFRLKMMTNHPDKVANLDPELQQYATKRTILIKNAYEELIKA